MIDTIRTLMKKNSFFTAEILALLAIMVVTISGGANPAFSKIALQDTPIFIFNFLRFLVATICLLPFFLKEKSFTRKDLLVIIPFSLLLTVQTMLFQFGVRLTTATIGGAIYIAGPILVAMLSYFFLSERFSSKKVLGIILGTLGSLIIIFLPQISQGAPFTGNIWENLLIAIAVLLTAVYTVFSKPLHKRFTPMQFTAVFIFLTTFLLFFCAIPEAVAKPDWWTQITPLSLIAILFVGCLGTSINYVAMQYAIKHGSPLVSSLSFYLLPIANFIWAYFLLGEQLMLGLLIGGVLAFIGVFLIMKKSSAKVDTLTNEPSL